jgi:hypothetical protein
MDTKKDLEDMEKGFHRIGIRMPKALYGIIEDMAWTDRVSINIEINDLLIFALTRLMDVREKDVAAERKRNNILPFIPEKMRYFAGKTSERTKGQDPSEPNEFYKRLQLITLLYASWREKNS